MADWIGSSRTNYFRVKDPEAFETAMAHLDVEVWNNKDDPRLFGIGCGKDSNGDWPSCDVETDEDFDFVEKVWPHLAEGEVAVFQTIGSEKLCYLTGHATAVNHQGKRIDLDIGDIYERAKRRFEVAQITEASY